MICSLGGRVLVDAIYPNYDRLRYFARPQLTLAHRGTHFCEQPSVNVTHDIAELLVIDPRAISGIRIVDMLLM